MRAKRKTHEGQKAGVKGKRKKQRKTTSALSPETKPGTALGKRPGSFTKNDPRINRTIPGPGRPRGSFAKKCRKILNSPKTWRAVRQTVRNPRNPAMKSMWSSLADRGHGKQNQSLDLSVPQGGEGEEQERPNAIVLLMGRLDTMEKRKNQAKESQST